MANHCEERERAGHGCLFAPFFLAYVLASGLLYLAGCAYGFTAKRSMPWAACASGSLALVLLGRRLLLA